MPYKERTSVFVKLETPGDAVEGEYQGNEAITLTNGNTAYRHTIRIEDGTQVSFLGGVVLDEVLSDVPIGTVVLVERTGTQEVRHGRSMKQFRVSVWQDEPD